MNEQHLQLQAGDGPADAVLLTAAEATEAAGNGGARRPPAVLMLTDIGGIRDASLGMARRLAGLGYTVLMPNVFYRTSRPPVWAWVRNMAEERSRRRFADLVTPLDAAAMERDSIAYLDFLAAHPAASGSGMGLAAAPVAAVAAVAGYCFTGQMALRAAAVRPQHVAAAASFHGGGLWTATPQSPHLVLPRVAARLYFGHAVEDGSMPAEAIEHFDAALAAWGGRYDSEVYAGAHHGWTLPDSPAYHEAQAERAFGKLRQLLAETLPADAA